MRSVRIILSRTSEYVAGDAYEVFGDRGIGVIDTEHPLTPQPVPLWEDIPFSEGHLCDGHLSGVHLGGGDWAGHLEGAHLCEGHLEPKRTLVWESDPYVFGRFQHLLSMMDAVGNRSSGSTTTFAHTINSFPKPPLTFEKTKYENETDQVVFAFVPQRPLAEAGEE